VLFPEIAIGIFDDSADVVAEGRTFLYIVAPFWAFFGGTMVIQGAFRGAGQTKVAMALSFLARWIFRIPVAIALAFGTVAVPGTGLAVEGLAIGVEGIWLAFAIGAFLTFLVAVFWFRLGRWTEGVIDQEETGDGPMDPPDDSSVEDPAIDSEPGVDPDD